MYWNVIFFIQFAQVPHVSQSYTLVYWKCKDHLGNISCDCARFLEKNNTYQIVQTRLTYLQRPYKSTGYINIHQGRAYTVWKGYIGVTLDIIWALLSAFVCPHTCILLFCGVNNLHTVYALGMTLSLCHLHGDHMCKTNLFSPGIKTF